MKDISTVFVTALVIAMGVADRSGRRDERIAAPFAIGGFAIDEFETVAARNLAVTFGKKENHLDKQKTSHSLDFKWFSQY